MPPRRLMLKLLPALALAALALPSAAFGQATRTWVSGVGDDANPCSRTAPCKTFAGAISKTANGGEINIIDPGGFGGVTITKSITIRARGGTGGALVSGTNAIVINAAATDKVTIDGLDINGIGTGAQTSLSGIKVLSAARVNILNNEIYRFRAGVVVAPTSAQTRVLLRNNQIHDNGIGLINAPGNNLIQFTSVVSRKNQYVDNTCAVVAGAFGTNASTPDAATNCGTAAGPAINKPATINSYHDGINLNGTGVFSRGSSGAVEFGWDEITNNAVGLDSLDSGVLRTVTNTNVINGNGSSDPANASVALTKRLRRR